MACVGIADFRISCHSFSCSSCVFIAKCVYRTSIETMNRLAAVALQTSQRVVKHQSAGLTFLALSAPPLLASCKGKTQPVRFGASVRSIHNDLPSIDSSNKEDCPLCKKYSQGPCGELFQKWLTCTDQHRHEGDGKIDRCAHFATPLAQCLKQNEELYDNMRVYDDEPEGLHDQWVSVVQQIESSNKPQPFPTGLRPTLEYRPQLGTGIAGFFFDYKPNHPIIMAYVKDTKTGELLAAGSMTDLFEYNGRGILKLIIPTSIEAVTVSALYDGGDDNDDLWLTHQVLVPR